MDFRERSSERGDRDNNRNNRDTGKRPRQDSDIEATRRKNTWVYGDSSSTASNTQPMAPSERPYQRPEQLFPQPELQRQVLNNQNIGKMLEIQQADRNIWSQIFSPWSYSMLQGNLLWEHQSIQKHLTDGSQETPHNPPSIICPVPSHTHPMEVPATQKSSSDQFRSDSNSAFQPYVQQPDLKPQMPTQQTSEQSAPRSISNDASRFLHMNPSVASEVRDLGKTTAREVIEISDSDDESSLGKFPQDSEEIQEKKKKALMKQLNYCLHSANIQCGKYDNTIVQHHKFHSMISKGNLDEVIACLGEWATTGNEHEKAYANHFNIRHIGHFMRIRDQLRRQ